MPILNCSVVNCYHHKNNMCCLNDIKVEGTTAEAPDSTACGSFREKTDTYTNAVNSTSQTPKDSVDIDCEAQKCNYNENCKCHAGHINVGDANSCKCHETKCQSFTTI